MLFESKFEFRGLSERKSKKTGETYRFVNLEDLEGSSTGFRLDDNCNPSSLEKGTSYSFLIDYNNEYHSFKVIDYYIIKGE